MKIYEDYSLLQHNTFGIDVKCNKFIEYDSIDDLSKIRESLTCPFLCIGHGSNLLFTHNYEGTILHCTKKGIRRLDDNDNENGNHQPSYIEVGGGEVWDDVVDWCVQHGYYGAENLSLIPGETGAAAVQNIGAYGVEAKDVIAFVDAYHLPTGKFRRFSNEECNYSYRSSIFKTDYKGQYAILSVTLKLDTVFTPILKYAELKEHFSSNAVITAREIREVIINIRNSKLPNPNTTGNAGSFFKNPVVDQSVFNALLVEYPNMPHYDAENGVKIPAGWMIDQCGW
ncbi:MAG: UDP-N-acetylmuramate dehydrogenase, partial [Prevotellaceae bacterium]|nr:UDP-N-acetylmuramate dehydrogenase [Prevotellaceae bacterium]